MRTAIFVAKPTEVTVQPVDPRDRELTVTPFNPKHPEYPAVGTLNWAVGVYLIVSRGELRIIGDHIRVETSLTETKDPWPDPPGLDLVALEKGATQAEIKQFFQNAKGIDI